MDDKPKRPEERATFIVRLARDGTSVWHGVVELVDGQRRGHVAGPDDLVSFIDAALAEGTAPRSAEPPEPPARRRKWN